MNPLLPTTTAAGRPTLPLWFDVPAQFAETDLGENPEQRAVRLMEQFARAMPETTVEQRLHLAMLQQVTVEKMIEQDAVYAATLLARAEGEHGPHPSTAQFTVLVQDAAGGNDETLETVAEQLREDGIDRDVGFVALPAGRALAVVENDELTLPATVFGQPEEHTHRIRQAQLILPFPDGERIATFALSTQCLDDWPDHLEIFVDIARTISFTPPAGTAITQVLGPSKATAREDASTTSRSIRDVLGGHADRTP